jgi:RIO-like serine/threonine protein kinase
MATIPVPMQSQAARPQAASLEDVVQRMSTGKRVRKTEIRSAGLAKELSAHTGLNRATAEASLQEVLNALGGQLGAGKQTPVVNLR